LRAAALCTLDVLKIANRYGLDPKDASAYNIQFDGCNPKFIDLGSFEYIKSDFWVGYKQFNEHFMAPLFIAVKRSFPINKLFGAYFDGIDLAVARNILGYYCFTSFHIFFGVWMQPHIRSSKKILIDKQRECSAIGYWSPGTSFW